MKEGMESPKPIGSQTKLQEIHKMFKNFCIAMYGKSKLLTDNKGLDGNNDGDEYGYNDQRFIIRADVDDSFKTFAGKN